MTETKTKTRIKVINATFAVPVQEAQKVADDMKSRDGYLECDVRDPTTREFYGIQNKYNRDEIEINLDECTRTNTERYWDAILDNLNLMGYDNIVGEVLKDKLGTSHRTIQQGFFRNVIMPALLHFKKMREKDYFDLRNEASCKLAKEMLDKIGEEPAIPFI